MLTSKHVKVDDNKATQNVGNMTSQQEEGFNQRKRTEHQLREDVRLLNKILVHQIQYRTKNINFTNQ